MPGQEWTRIEYTEHMYDIIGRSGIAVHLQRNHCHPREHGNERAVRFPEKERL